MKGKLFWLLIKNGYKQTHMYTALCYISAYNDVFCCNSFNACRSLRDRFCFGFVICISVSCDLTSLVLLYSSRRRNKNSELSYEAELSCLSKSSISLAREKKNSAIFGSQETTTLDRNLVSVKWRHRLISQLVSVLSFSTRVFFFQIDSHIFFRLKFQNFDSCFFFRSWTYILQISTHVFYCIRCTLQVST